MTDLPILHSMQEYYCALRVRDMLHSEVFSQDFRGDKAHSAKELKELQVRIDEFVSRNFQQ